MLARDHRLSLPFGPKPRTFCLPEAALAQDSGKIGSCKWTGSRSRQNPVSRGMEQVTIAKDIQQRIRASYFGRGDQQRFDARIEFAGEQCSDVDAAAMGSPSADLGMPIVDGIALFRSKTLRTWSTIVELYSISGMDTSTVRPQKSKQSFSALKHGCGHRDKVRTAVLHPARSRSGDA